ncbi:GntR family transcriptional regulator [Treponema primitia]|uniref:GntR family transcriptional regulator n=1 Tax=Treponema primitia TaxID=88058 RepID=UPI00025550F3|nr:GntR family transcriptional regulator [Treponema primitia]
MEVKVPKYVFLKEELLKKMKNGELTSAARIPSENELSRLYGLSIMTVRKALSDLVYENKVVRIKGKGSFVAESNARELVHPKSADTGIVALVVMYYEQTESTIINIISGAQEVFATGGYSMVLECSNKNVSSEVDIIDKCIRSKVEGVLIFPTDPNANVGKLSELEAMGIPLVMLDRWFDDFPCTVVSSYHMDGMCQITQHLIQKGHRKIAFVAAEHTILANEAPEHITCVHRERLAGYKAALKQNDIPFEEGLCLMGEKLQYQTLDNLIENNGVTAFACINDRIGVDVLAYLKGRGIRAPEDISVTGFDDNQNAKQENLTTIRQHFQELGEIGAQKLLERIQGDVGKSRTILPVELVVRGSSGMVNNQFGRQG